MRLKETIKLTELPKKTIYFYIEENLVTPIKDRNNGYYEFSDEDIKKLKLIKALRNLDMSINEIKEVFNYPMSFNTFLYKKRNNSIETLNIQLSKLKNITYLLDTIAPNSYCYNLTDEQIDKITHIKVENYLQPYIKNVDARFIAIILWAPYLDIIPNEYTKFLWEKIIYEINNFNNNDLVHIIKMIDELPENIIFEKSSYRFKLFNQLIHGNNYKDNFIKLLNDKIRNLLGSDELKEKWKLSYKKLIVPTTKFNQSPAKKYLLEYNSNYVICRERFDEIAKEIFDKSEEYKALFNSLNPYFDYANIDELEIIMYFDNSIYSYFDINEIKQF